MRICSLLPSCTEILYALGLDDQLVGVSHECDYPAAAGLKPKVTRSEIHSGLRGTEIDGRVRQELNHGGSLYTLDVGILEALEPDIIFTQQLCTVCAVSYENVCSIAHTLSSKPRVVNIEPTSVESILHSIREIGDLTGTGRRSQELVEGMHGRIERITSFTDRLARQNVVFLEWLDPPFCAGHWIPELLEMAGGSDPFARKRLPSVQLAWNRIIEYNPKLIIISCCGFSVERTVQELRALNPSLRENISALKGTKIAIVDGASYFSRPGVRIVDSLEIAATIIHPDLFPIDFPEDVMRCY